MSFIMGTNVGLVETAPTTDLGEDVSGFGNPMAQRVTTVDAATVIEMGFWLANGTESSILELGIYDDIAGEPGNLLYSTTTAVSAIPGWLVSTGLNWELEASTTYWLAIAPPVIFFPWDAQMLSDASERLSIQIADTLLDPWEQFLSTDVMFGIYALLSGPKTIESEIIYKNAETITSATLTAIYTGSGTLTFYLSADGGTNFEEVTSGTQHTFTNTGEELKYKIVGKDITLTKLEVSV